MAQLYAELAEVHLDLEAHWGTRADPKTGLPKRVRDLGNPGLLKWPVALRRRLDAAQNEIDRREADHPRILAKLHAEEGKRTLAAFNKACTVPA